MEPARADEPTTAQPPGPVARQGPLRRTLLVVLLLVAVGAGLAAWLLLHRHNEAADVASDAREYLRKHKVAPLTGSLQKILAEAEKAPDLLTRTQDHRLLAERAPEFELADQEGKLWSLKELLAGGPVVLVFYYGYHCNHCVSQLFDLNEDLPLFRELGARVVAVSADPPVLTRQRFQQYGPFGFPVLSDPGNKVAETYRVFTPAHGGKKADLLHGTFVIDRDGVVQWVNVGDAPFSGNQTLLYHLAKLEGRLPSMTR
jgi:peroxiredoxin Q/BCP